MESGNKEIKLNNYLEALKAISREFLKANLADNYNQAYRKSESLPIQKRCVNLDSTLQIGGFWLKNGEYQPPKELKSMINDIKERIIDLGVDACRSEFALIEQQLATYKNRRNRKVKTFDGERISGICLVGTAPIARSFITEQGCTVSENILHSYSDFIELFNQQASRPIAELRISLESVSQGQNGVICDVNEAEPMQSKQTAVPSFADILMIQQEGQAERIISRIRECMQSNIAVSEIAVILVALKQMRLLKLDNAYLLARVWGKEFGYRSSLKSLETGLNNHISGDHTKFERKKRDSIEFYKELLQ